MLSKSFILLASLASVLAAPAACPAKVQTPILPLSGDGMFFNIFHVLINPIGNLD